MSNFNKKLLKKGDVLPLVKMLYSSIKSLHIIFMVCYFSGLFYLVRLFVYYKDTDVFEAQKKNMLREQYLFMIRRLWNIITVPAGALMSLFGLVMIFLNPSLLRTSWFHLKMSLLLGLALYHFWSWKKILSLKKLKGSDLPMKNIKLRQANEIPSIILFFIVFIAILKGFFIEHLGIFSLCFFLFSTVLVLIIKLTNKK